MYRKNVHFAASIIVLLLVCAGIALFFENLNRAHDADIAAQEALGGSLAAGIRAQANSGDVAGALQKYETVLASTTLSERTLASVVLVGTSLRNAFTASPSDIAQDIQELKTVAGSNQVRPLLQAYALDAQVQEFNNSAYNPVVFGMIFTGDAPYILVKDTSTGGVSRTASIRGLLVSSYKLSPTYSAAIGIAVNDIQTLHRTETPQPGTIDTAGIISQAENALKNADSLVNSSSQMQSTDPTVAQAYLVDRAFVIGGLAHFTKDPAYMSGYKEAYQNAISVLSSVNTMQANEMLAQTRFMYASYLILNDNDTGSAKTLLDQVALFEASDPNVANSPLVATVHSLKATRPVNQFPTPLTSLTAISSKFNVFVEGVN